MEMGEQNDKNNMVHEPVAVFQYNSNTSQKAKTAIKSKPSSANDEWWDRSDESPEYKAWINAKLDNAIKQLNNGTLKTLTKQQYNLAMEKKFGRLDG